MHGTNVVKSDDSGESGEKDLREQLLGLEPEVLRDLADSLLGAPGKSLSSAAETVDALLQGPLRDKGNRFRTRRAFKAELDYHVRSLSAADQKLGEADR